ncbi:3-deoxy-7-phosphoheptulonate synthase [Streptomyces sp. NPDC006530]|uniref:3-deoxy-7-phosphoheptulonate synthase n=1 Tax=Streptomyces sp. NPDC006530 TaxID=3364750 RepID=UPI0036C00668
MGNTLADIERAGARHQPEWDNPPQVELVRAILSSVTPLVTPAQVEKLSSHLARVATGEMQVLKAGDCAEDPAECTAAHIQGKAGLIDLLAQNLETATGKRTLRVGRIAGQFSKPRSSRFEKLGDAELPSFFGHMINGPEPTHESRRPDPLRMLTGYMAAREIMMQLGWVGPAPRLDASAVWTSHEALLLDYEVSMLRELDGGRRWLSSTHWPWIGERTRQIDGPHVALLAQVINPVACKVGPSMTAGEIVELCDRLDPEREPGRLSLIVRMGADLVADRLPRLVEAVRSAGHPVIWLSDPMHGNTDSAPDGTKYRLVGNVAREVRGFRRVLDLAGVPAGGLHLEATPDDVTECVVDTAELGSGPVTSLCDPRLNTRQAIDVVSAWSGY